MVQQKINKYCYGWKLSVNYGQGWEFESFYDEKEPDAHKDAKADIKAYRENCEYPARLTHGRMLNPEYLAATV